MENQNRALFATPDGPLPRYRFDEQALPRNASKESIQDAILPSLSKRRRIALDPPPALSTRSFRANLPASLPDASRPSRRRVDPSFAQRRWFRRKKTPSFAWRSFFVASRRFDAAGVVLRMAPIPFVRFGFQAAKKPTPGARSAWDSTFHFLLRRRARMRFAFPS